MARSSPVLPYSYGYSWGGAGTQNDMTAFRDAFMPEQGIFSPNYPLAPPERETMRVWDYPVGYNTVWTPRSYTDISFAELRALAKYHDLTRLAIETRKDQIDALDWTITSADRRNPGPDADKRIEALTEFWARPDGYLDFQDWLHTLVEDVLVTDAACLEVRRNRGGDVLGFDVIDGSTIKVLIDHTGRSPRHPAPAYEQVIHGRPWLLASDGRPRVGGDLDAPPKQFTDAQLIYAPRNRRPGEVYGFSPVEQIITIVNIGLRRQAQQLQYFTDGNIPPGFFNSPEGWSASQIKDFQDWFDAKLAGNTAQRWRLIWTPAGAKYTPFKEPPKKDEFDDWLARVICYAFSLPPSALVPQVNRATAATAQEAALREGLAPLQAYIARMINGLITRVQGQKDLRFIWGVQHAIDEADEAAVLDKYVRNGSMAINEARERLGLAPIEGGDEPAIYTSQGPILVSKLPSLGVGDAGAPGEPADGGQTDDEAEMDEAA